MAVDIETVRLECLREAVRVYLHPKPLEGGGTLQFKDPVKLAKEFAGFVLGLEYDEENDEWVEPEIDPNADIDDSELQPHVRAFNDEGQEL